MILQRAWGEKGLEGEIKHLACVIYYLNYFLYHLAGKCLLWWALLFLLGFLPFPLYFLPWLCCSSSAAILNLLQRASVLSYGESGVTRGGVHMHWKGNESCDHSSTVLCLQTLDTRSYSWPADFPLQLNTQFSASPSNTLTAEFGQAYAPPVDIHCKFNLCPPILCSWKIYCC